MGLLTGDNKRSTFAVAGSILMLVIAGVVLWASFSSPATHVTPRAWYYDPAAKKLIAGDTHTPPTNPPGVVRAHVYSKTDCADSSSRFIGYLSKSADAGPAGDGEPGPPGHAQTRTTHRLGDLLVADPDLPDDWVDASNDRGQAIMNLTGKTPADVATLRECFPG